ncbi:hypothetical protein D9757_014409 [Collybiopsis confluens]|uniref:Uncharacterized protein n=1 Tax=Collybiopsis confluens TaxID=2823264 RepID=A0A8H5CM15_9AGAR|nr:hypothetical protein D9757_014409 [Collybiopsis confluens]
MNPPRSLLHPSPYLFGFFLTSHQLKSIAEQNLTAEEIASANDDYALAINRYFHEAESNQIILSTSKEQYDHFYGQAVVPSYDGKAPELDASCCRQLLREFILGFPPSIRKEFGRIGVGTMQWPRYYPSEPSWLWECMYDYLKDSAKGQKEEEDSGA